MPLSRVGRGTGEVDFIWSKPYLQGGYTWLVWAEHKELLKEKQGRERDLLQHILLSSMGQGASGQCDRQQDQLSVGRGHQLLVGVEDSPSRLREPGAAIDSSLCQKPIMSDSEPNSLCLCGKQKQLRVS